MCVALSLQPELSGAEEDQARENMIFNFMLILLNLNGRKVSDSRDPLIRNHKPQWLEAKVD